MSGTRLLAGVLLVMSLWTDRVHAGAFENGRDLKQYCAEDAAQIKQAACFAYILGIADLLVGYHVAGLQICFPADVRFKLILAKTKEYLAEHPERLHDQPNKLVLDALATAFPCKQ
jgi:hypothetical protein